MAMNIRAAPARTFFGEPPALAYLTFTEAWERFSYYGMTALLTLYMTKALFLPGHVEHIVLFAPLRAALDGLFGRSTPLALASQIFGLYTALVWLTPVLGGLIADRLIGRRNAVVLGSLSMCCGHFAMAFDKSFLAALLLLVAGCGLLKGNISAQVGQLYRSEDDAARTRGFAIFSMAINVGSVAGPVLCGAMAQVYGWHIGFGVSGVLMLAGLITYLIGYRHLPDVIDVSDPAIRAQGGKPHHLQPVFALAAIASITVFESIACLQSNNIGMFWVDQHVALKLSRISIPAAWFASISSLSGVLAVPLIFALWRWQEASGFGVSDIDKIATGAWICVLANLVLVAAAPIHGLVSPLWPIVSFALDGVAFIYYWPTLLALVFRVAPKGLKSTLLGVAFLSLFISNVFIGALGSLYEAMSPRDFWLMHALIALVGAVLAMTAGQSLARMMTSSSRWVQPEQSHRPRKGEADYPPRRQP